MSADGAALEEAQDFRAGFEFLAAEHQRVLGDLARTRTELAAARDMLSRTESVGRAAHRGLDEVLRGKRELHEAAQRLTAASAEERRRAAELRCYVIALEQENSTLRSLLVAHGLATAAAGDSGGEKRGGRS
jgi:hypothetical protein